MAEVASDTAQSLKSSKGDKSSAAGVTKVSFCGGPCVFSEASQHPAVPELCVFLQIAVSTGHADALADVEKSNIVNHGFVLPSITLYTILWSASLHPSRT